MTETTLVNNPYAGVDWGNIEQKRDQIHVHTKQSNTNKDLHDTPNETVDQYADAGVEVFSMSEGGNVDNAWPWGDWETIYDGVSGVENRYPLGHQDQTTDESKKIDVLGFAGAEQTYDDAEHIMSLFCELIEADHQETERDAVIQAIVDDNGIAGIAHPARYGNPWDWPRWISNFEKFDKTELFGFAAYNKNAYVGNIRDVATWDRLNLYFCPDRPIWGYAEDDVNSINGAKFDTRFNWVLLDESDFQAGDRDAARDAYENGRFFFSNRVSKDSTVPQFDSLTVDEENTTITVSATDANSIVWICNGRVEGTGSTFDYSDLLGPFIRILLVAEEGVTSSQPITFSRSSDGLLRQSESGDVDLVGEVEEDNDHIRMYGYGDMEVNEIDETGDQTRMTADGTLHVGGEYTEA